MILVDTSIWVDHFRRKDGKLAGLLRGGEVCIHPFVIGELACGNISNRNEILLLLKDLPLVSPASEEEVLHFIEIRKLYGRGLGYIDMHLLASALINKVSLWTKDRRLSAVYTALDLD